MSNYTVAEILQVLNTSQRRATYGCVGQVVGIHPLSVQNFLTHRQPNESWIVAKDGMPTGYEDGELHPQLQNHPHVIDDPAELINLMGGR